MIDRLFFRRPPARRPRWEWYEISSWSNIVVWFVQVM